MFSTGTEREASPTLARPRPLLGGPAPSFGPASFHGDPCPTSSHRTHSLQFLLLPMVLPSNLHVSALSTAPAQAQAHCDPRALLYLLWYQNLTPQEVPIPTSQLTRVDFHMNVRISLSISAGRQLEA